MLLIGELKQIKRTASGSRLVIKHVPDQAFRDEHDRRWGATAPEENLEFERSADCHWLVVATFSADITGTPFIEERAVVPTDTHWLLEDGVSSDRAHAAAPRIGAALGSAARALS